METGKQMSSTEWMQCQAAVVGIGVGPLCLTTLIGDVGLCPGSGGAPHRGGTGTLTCSVTNR